MTEKLYRDTTHIEDYRDAYLSYVLAMDRVEDFGEMVKHFRLLNLYINAQVPFNGKTIVHQLRDIYELSDVVGIHVGELILKLPNIDLILKTKMVIRRCCLFI